MKKEPESLRELIEEFCKDWAATNRRPDMGDVTIRSLFAVELARAIHKYARVTKLKADEMLDRKM